MALETDVGSGRNLRLGSDNRQFRWLYAATFTGCLSAILLSRLAPWGRSTRATRRSVIDEAKARTGKIVPFLFMG